MKKSLFRANSLLILVVVSQFIFPLIGISIANSKQSNLQNLDLSNIDFNEYGIQSHESLVRNKKYNSELSIFGKHLYEQLYPSGSDKLATDESVEVIVRFKKKIPKEKRIEIIESLFNQYEILRNYDIIPGVYCKLSTFELLKNEKSIFNYGDIEKIYKTKTVSRPVIIDDQIESSALDENFYPNWWISAIGADNLEYDGTGVNVTVIDSGIYDHPDLDVILREDLVTYGGGSGDLNGHGTHVAGIIASNGASSGGLYRGVAPGVNLIDAQGGNVSGGLLNVDIVNAIEWSVQTAKSGIISMSFGASLFDADPNIWDAITNAKDTYGTIFVSSAGNSGPDYYTAGTPASHPDVISVGASDKNNNLASFSSWGPSLSYLGFPDVVAPGVNIISTSAMDSVIEKEKKYIGDFFDFAGDADYIPLSGTSMSCPVVSGAIAILKEAFPSLTAETARIALMEGASPLSDVEDHDFLKAGAGLINVSASLDYLKKINSTYSNVNNITKFFPDILPIKPYDLLNFPGDSQTLNVSIISGMANNIDIQYPNINGITLSLDNDPFTFGNPSIGYSTITISINADATTGIYEFPLNLTINGVVRDTANISIEVKLPEKRILMESYHGLNDWLEDQFSFVQIGFYDALKDLAELNISTDYYMEYWQPYYDKDTDNYILTEERLAQYDLIVLQAPILPYSPEEINNLVNYFNSGGNILYLGTRYQEVCSENINALFSALEIDSQIKEENILLDQWVGLGSSVYSIPASPLPHELMQGVDRFLWLYGHSFDISGNAEPIATINNQNVGFAYNGSSEGKGNIIGFGDLHWLYYDYPIKTSDYYQNHRALLSNMMDYYFDDENVSLNIHLNATRTQSGVFSISIYSKNLPSNQPIDNSTLDGNLTAYITDGNTYEPISLTFPNNGIAINRSVDIPFSENNIPFTIIVNYTENSVVYNQTSKILFYGTNQIPSIQSLSTNKEEVDKEEQIRLQADMDDSIYDLSTYISYFSYSFYNMEKTINTTTQMNNLGSSYFKQITTPNNPPGYGFFYIIPYDGNYFTANSPRQFFEINNYQPIIDEVNSYFTIGSSARKSFSDTSDENFVYPQTGTQGDIITFEIDADDTGTSFKDLDTNLTVSVNFFMAALSRPIGGSQSISIMFPSSYYVSIMDYESGFHRGTLTIPNTLSYSSIKGSEAVSTAASSQQNDYIGILYINVIDSEGATVEDPFIIILFINPAIDWVLIITIIAIVAGVLGLAALIYYIRRKRIEPEESGRDYYQEYEPTLDGVDSQYSSYESTSPIELGEIFYCPYCGTKIGSSKKFCPNCGKELNFE
ncbi:MAG: S8 family serine peptidase [Candidatus Lokiarchaeota archaeon]|nr:S8 family serine peptidase [Candidatus Lokiarchaeota archaeon]